MATDESKLEYIAQIPKGRDLLMTLMQKNQEVVISDIEDRFGIKEMILLMLNFEFTENFLHYSFLYYFGVLTITEDTEDLKIILRVPNLVMKSLYVDRIYKMLQNFSSRSDREPWSGG